MPHQFKFLDIMGKFIWGSAACLLVAQSAVAVTPNQPVVKLEIESRYIADIDVKGLPISPLKTPNFNYCHETENVFVAAETDGFWINICGEDAPTTYVGVSKKDNSSIRLKLSAYDTDRERFVAFNNDVRYFISPVRLEATQGPRTLLVQDVANWQETGYP